jgi:hypothetical protein
MSEENFGSGASRLSGATALLLGWRPWELWDATPAELATALRADSAAEAPDTETLAELIRRFPDERDTNEL